MKTKAIFLMLLLFMSSTILLLNINTPLGSVDEPANENLGKSDVIINSYTQQWLDNPTFLDPIGPTWYSGLGGYLSDVAADSGNGHVNYTVIGDSGAVTFLADPPSASDWTAFSNPDFPVMPYADDGPGGTLGWGIDARGCWAWHEWDEGDPGGQLGQTPSVEWKRNVTMPINMSDYEITSASLTAICNGTVDANINTIDDGGTVAVGDYARFYVEISDLTGEQNYELAYNQTSDLGTDGGPLTQADTVMVTVPEALLIFFLTSILATDHYNFTITLGIFIYCEDNDPTYDEDFWTMLRINSFNLTFTYEKKIQSGSFVQWKQEGDQLPTPVGTLVVDEAKLHFKYKTDQSWTADSPNSEFRIIINNNTHSEAVALSTANQTYQDGKAGGFDVTPLILKGVNITVAIRLYLADNFRLTNNITLSVDDVYLNISYTVYQEGPTLSVSSNTSYLYTNQIAQLTVNCENGSGTVDTWWYRDPFTSGNVTLGTDFTGLRTELLNYTSISAGAKIFKFWANSSNGLEVYDDILVVWVEPTPPSLNVAANATILFTGQIVQLTSTCNNGSGTVDTWWYRDPFTGGNVTLGTDFTGLQIELVNFTSTNATSKLFQFWANSSFGLEVQDDITVIWVEPQPATLNLLTNDSNPYINEWSRITVTCISGDGNVSVLWYYNPMDGQNHTLATNFAGTQVFNLDFTNDTAGPREFQFWANSSVAAAVYKTITVFWVDPVYPVLNVIANKTDPYVDKWVSLTVTCISGSGNVSRLWYYNPMDGQNHTLAINFEGIQINYLYFTNDTAGSHQFDFWANSTFGLETYRPITIVWVQPTPPVLNVVANITDPFINEWARLTVTCISGSGNVSRLWYYNPMDGQNHTLATNFAGIQIINLDFTNDTAGSYQFLFWVNSSYVFGVYDSISVIWVNPQEPILSVGANATLLDVNEWTRITCVCQSGTGNISRLWYYNPMDGQNHTLATNYEGSQIFNLDFTNDTSGAYFFRFWANSTIGLTVSKELTIMWVSLTPPSLNVVANITILEIYQWTQLIVQCQSGSEDISRLWYYNPMDGQNHTLAANFAGFQIIYLNFMNETAGGYLFEFWANSTLGLQAYDALTIVWVNPTPPSLNAIANTTSLYIDQWVQITVSCQSGTTNVSRLWYYNPMDGQNHTIASNFDGLNVYYLDFTNDTAGAYQFKFWANASLGIEAFDSVIVVWITPLPSSISLLANVSNPYTGDWVEIRVICQSGSVNVSELWYKNPFDGQNHSLATNFIFQTIYLDFMNNTQGAYEFKFWANDSLGLEAYDSITIVWITPAPPTLTVVANIHSLEVGSEIILTITCTNGSGFIVSLWYYNPLDGQNHTLNTYFTSDQFNLTITSNTAGEFEFKAWATSSRGEEVFDSDTVGWYEPEKGGFLWLIALLAGILAAVAAAVLAYQLYFKVPKTIRTIRKTKSNIRKGNDPGPLDVASRENTVNEMFEKKLKMAKIPKPMAPGIKAEVKGGSYK